MFRIISLGIKVAILCSTDSWGDHTEEFRMDFKCEIERDDCMVLLEEFSKRKPQKAFIQEWTNPVHQEEGPIIGLEDVQDSECAQ